MRSIPSVSDDSFDKVGQDFSLVLGGPLFQLLRRARLTDDAYQLVHKRVVTFMLAAWVPILALSVFEGHALDGNVAVPFLRDFDVHIRFLVAMPLLLVSELLVHQRIRPIVEQFLARDLIPKGAIARFNTSVASALRLRNSVVAEVVMIVAVYVFGITIVWRHYTVLSAATWYATPSPNGIVLSLAGIWYGYVSLPLFQFLLIRWYFRMFIWARFLWQVSRIELILTPTHPDRVGGIGFLSNTMFAFASLAAAHGALLAGLLANRIFYAGAKLTEYKFEIAFIVVWMLCLTLGPLLVFCLQLASAKRRGSLEYGALAERYVRAFDTKWLHGGAAGDELLIGSADIQSLADLSNSFEVVRSMHLIPVTRDGLVLLVAATLAPVVPLLLTMMPLEDLLKALFGILF